MKKILFLTAMLALLISSCNSRESNEKTSPEKEAVSINPEALVSYEMDVSGMTCTGCESTIKTSVSELPGVSSVDAKHMDAKTFVVFDSTLTSIKDVTIAIESKGYKVNGSKIKVKDPSEDKAASAE